MRGCDITLKTLDRIEAAFASKPDEAKSTNAVALETGINWMQAKVAVRRLFREEKLILIENSNHVQLFKYAKKTREKAVEPTDKSVECKDETNTSIPEPTYTIGDIIYPSAVIFKEIEEIKPRYPITKYDVLIEVMDYFVKHKGVWSSFSQVRMNRSSKNVADALRLFLREKRICVRKNGRFNEYRLFED